MTQSSEEERRGTQVWVSKLSPNERQLLNQLTPDERKSLLIEAAKAKLRALLAAYPPDPRTLPH